jgi:hypothetical protein
VLAVVACAKPLTGDDCDALLDRYTELLVKSQNADTPAQRIVELQAQARELAHHDPKYEFAACSAKVSRRHFECAMSAPSVDDMERCLIF